MLACLADEKCYFRPLPVTHAAAAGEGNEDFTEDSYWYIVKGAKATLDAIPAAATQDTETTTATTAAACRERCIAATWDCNSFNWEATAAAAHSCVMYNKKLTVE